MEGNENVSTRNKIKFFFLNSRLGRGKKRRKDENSNLKFFFLIHKKKNFVPGLSKKK